MSYWKVRHELNKKWYGNIEIIELDENINDVLAKADSDIESEFDRVG